MALKELERFHQRALCFILGIWWQDKVTNTEVFDKTTRISIEAMLPPLDRPCDQDGGSQHSKLTSLWRVRAGSQETGPSLETFQGHSQSRPEMV